MNQGPLPRHVEAELLQRWREPHRRYHAEGHLRAGLETLKWLGAGPLELVAFWFHDAVHTGASPVDERASADLARELLHGILGEAAIGEVCRLVLLTVDHSPERDDPAGARVTDADLQGVGLSWESYEANLEAIRAEHPGISPAEWATQRRRFVSRMLERDTVFHTAKGLALWERQARVNLLREAGQLSASSW